MAAYIDSFTTNAFQSDTASGKFKMTLFADTLCLGGGMDIRLSKLWRNTGGKFENVIAAYEVDTSGNMYIYSDEPFNGRLVVTTDE